MNKKINKNDGTMSSELPLSYEDCKVCNSDELRVQSIEGSGLVCCDSRYIKMNLEISW